MVLVNSEVAAIGRFRVVRALGAGGMGVVYEGTDPKLGRRVALKLMPAEARLDAERTARFLREARAAAAVTHPNVVVVYEVGQDPEHGPYLAMEYVRGGSLREQLREGVSMARAIDIARDVAAGVAAAHAEGLVHRDLKPENVLIAPDGTAKVADFGLAKVFGPPDANAPTHAQVLTEEGAMLGSPGYMAPEQARGRAVDARTDVYALGVLLYELCAGRRPFVGPTPMAEVAASIADEPPDLRSLAPNAPTGLVALVHQCLRRDPNDRPADAGEVFRGLEELTSVSEVDIPVDPNAATMTSDALEPPSQRGRSGWIAPAVVAAALTVGGMALWAISSGDPDSALAPTHDAPRVDREIEPPAEPDRVSPARRPLLPPRGLPAPDPHGPLVVPCEGDVDACAEGHEPWCDRESRRVACCAAGLVPMDEAGICGCPPGGTTVAEVSERGCELATMEGLTWASLRSVVSEAVDELDECYEPVIEAHPGGAGQVTVRFIVSPQGDVFDVSIDDSSLPFDGVQRCLLDVLAPLRFAPPGGGEPILVRYPIAFASR